MSDIINSCILNKELYLALNSAGSYLSYEPLLTISIIIATHHHRRTL